MGQIYPFAGGFNLAAEISAGPPYGARLRSLDLSARCGPSASPGQAAVGRAVGADRVLGWAGRAAAVAPVAGTGSGRVTCDPFPRA